MNLFLTVMLFPLLLAAPGDLLAQGPRGGRGFPFTSEMIEEVAGRLGLAPDTLKKIRQLAYDTEKKVIEIDYQMQRSFLELRQLLDEDLPDTERVMGQIEKVGQLDIRLRQEQIRLLLEVRKLLSPEQRAKLRELMLPKRPPPPPHPHHEKGAEGKNCP